MPGPTQQPKQLPTDPSLSDLLELFKKQVKLELNCHAVATIQSFDSAAQTATATINYKRTYFQVQTTGGKPQPYTVDYPPLTDCPVICLGGGQASLTFPVTAGDECLVFFNDKDMDGWFSGSSSAAVGTPRLHSFADAVLIVGLRSMATALKNYDGTRAVLQMGQALMAVGGAGGTKVKVANQTTSLNTLMQSLISDLLVLTDPLAGAAFQFGVLAAASSGPLAPLKPAFLVLQTLFTTANTALNTAATQFGGLLE